VQLGIRDAAAAQRAVPHCRQQILRLPDARSGDDEPLTVFVRADADDVGAQAAEQPAFPVQRFRGVGELRQQRREPRPGHRPFRRITSRRAGPSTRSVTTVDEVAFLAVVADLEDRGMRDLERPRLAEKPRADGVPVAIGTLAQQPDGDRVAERAVRAAEVLAAETARTERLTQLVGAEQSARGGCRRDTARDHRRSRRAACRPPARRRRPRPWDTGDRAISRARGPSTTSTHFGRSGRTCDGGRTGIPEQRGDEPARVPFVERQTPRQHLVDDDGRDCTGPSARPPRCRRAARGAA
jgi:hypothetical protein